MFGMKLVSHGSLQWKCKPIKDIFHSQTRQRTILGSYVPQEFGKIWNLFLRNAGMVCHKPDSTWQLSCFVINCFWSRLWQQPLFQMVCNYANIIYWTRECTLRTVISVSYSWKWFISFESCKLTADQYFSCNRCSSKTCFSLFLYLDKKS